MTISKEEKQKMLDAMARLMMKAMGSVIKKYNLPPVEAAKFFTEECERLMREEEEAIDIQK